MMMPANFVSVNSEVVYGGGVIETLGDYTAPVWTAKNVKQFNTNVITLVSNTFFKTVTDNTLGVIFGGNWGGDDGVKMFGEDGKLKTALYGEDASDMSFLNKTMRTLGALSVAYTLGTTSAVVNFNDGPMGFEFNA